MWHRIGKGGTRYWGKRGAGFILTDGEAVLLLKRSDKGDMAGFWTIPGGKVEDGETFLGGAQRETKEEAGHMPNCTRVATFDHQDGRFTFKSFLCKVDKRFDVKLSDEHTDSRWFPIEDVGNIRIHPGLRAIWSSVLRTVREKVKPHHQEIEETVIDKHEMGSKSFSAWEMQRYLEGFFRTGTAPITPASPPTKAGGGLSPQFRQKMQEIAEELELPQPMDPYTERALTNILVRAFPPPLGLPEGGMLRIDWFETVIDAIVKHHLTKNGGKIDYNHPAIRQAINPVQLLRTLRTKMPGDNFNPQSSLEGARGASPREHDSHFNARSDQYNLNRNLPQTPAASAAPAAPSPTGAGSTATLDDLLDKLPKEMFMNGKKTKAAADIIYLVQSLIQSFGISGATFDRMDVARLKAKKGLP